MRKSLRDFPAVEKIPSEIIDLCRTLKDGNTKRLLSLLIEHPKEITLGVCDRQNNMVQCEKMLFSLQHSCLTQRVPLYILQSGIAAVNQSFSIRKLPYRVWFSCSQYNPVKIPPELVFSIEALNEYIKNHNLPCKAKLVQIRIRQKVKPSTTPFVMGLVKIA